MKIKSALVYARKYLDNLESEIILSSILHLEIIEIYKRLDGEIEEDMFLLYKELIEKRKSGIPVEYIIEKTEFMGIPFKINSDVLIPRQETEILVGVAINEAKNFFYPRIVDVGCGSGVIAISIAKILSPSLVVGIDISEKALVLAKENAKTHGVHVFFVVADMLSATKKKFDIIVCNPPYVETKLVPKYEPRISLDGGWDGLSFYPKIFEEGSNLLLENGKIIVEIGASKLTDVSKIGEEYGFFLEKAIKDYSSIERVLVFAR